ncbi:Asp-tRNA(Asn)/Glu-tRNA(Gln) amidotransferase subunit GatC [Thiomicrospira sp. WB1]|uniref:Asp-tRNA(Asn)/Glu-tRNA(Gln) amidotransferase subunit GatC n=1 Tax=Thiomicrospira sp. WB1 TaxID=1685380 RepID=UPI000746E6B6|nr:Asp-tRNA(Asn)/Glu-tRNA(Gln) amidotransferase subunit GatC [Thiomicrospira sp. WB1]KUJ71554.1 glutamyl-tRNA amidotransferase [Thiomicrospira sp. WB1]
MAIEKKDVTAIARLAALSVEEEEIGQVAGKLNHILDVLQTMQSVETDGVEPMSHPLDQVQRLREDTVTETNQRDRYQRIAPAAEKGLYLVPQVIEQV